MQLSGGSSPKQAAARRGGGARSAAAARVLPGAGGAVSSESPASLRRPELLAPAEAPAAAGPSTARPCLPTLPLEDAVSSIEGSEVSLSPRRQEGVRPPVCSQAPGECTNPDWDDDSERTTRVPSVGMTPPSPELPWAEGPSPGSGLCLGSTCGGLERAAPKGPPSRSSAASDSPTFGGGGLPALATTTAAAEAAPPPEAAEPRDSSGAARQRGAAESFATLFLESEEVDGRSPLDPECEARTFTCGSTASTLTSPRGAPESHTDTFCARPPSRPSAARPTALRRPAAPPVAETAAATRVSPPAPAVPRRPPEQPLTDQTNHSGVHTLNHEFATSVGVDYPASHEPRCDKLEKEVQVLCPFFGENVMRCVYSGSWSLRDAALQKMARDLQSGKHGDDELDCLVGGVAAVLQHSFQDENSQVFISSAGLLQAACERLAARIAVPAPEVQAAGLSSPGLGETGVARWKAWNFAESSA
mmetsp:Transcript_13811/g.38283  ORF Transcript_13811/g.38283 Transcript_13811/m.38283 type:complete len:475 (-) Transcript_13811:53-1477(-)